MIGNIFRLVLALMPSLKVSRKSQMDAPHGSLHHQYLSPSISKLTLFLLLLLLPLILNVTPSSSSGWQSDPTYGFEELPLNQSNLHIQKPYDLPVSDRYSFINGIHKLWVYATDHPLSKGSPTRPRSEIFLNKYIYYSGVWQFEAHGYVPCGTSGVCITQVFGAAFPRNTTLMLRVYNGSLYYYHDTVLVPNIYDRWFRVNVIHDVAASNLKVYIDGEFKFETSGHGGTFHYFKCGVYAQGNASYYMESRWKGIRVLKKSD